MLSPLPVRTGPFAIVTLSGSLRTASTNALVLEALAQLASPPLALTAFTGLGDLPHFNPDLDTDDDRPAPVRAWRRMVARSDALVICSPEYAHGVPGSLKNALDWLVSGPEFPALPVTLINTSARSTHAQAALAETIRTMSGHLVPPGGWVLPLAGSRPTLAAFLLDETLAGPLRGLLTIIETAVSEARAAGQRLVPAE